LLQPEIILAIISSYTPITQICVINYTMPELSSHKVLIK
jgi:hypothetical protein